MNEAMIEKFEDAGFKRWTKGDYDRLYINATALGLEYDCYKSGNIHSACFKGEDISNAHAGRMLATKVWVNVATGKLFWKGSVNAEDELIVAACALKNKILAENA